MRRSKSNLITESINAATWFPRLRDLTGTFTTVGTTLIKSTNTTDAKKMFPNYWLVNAANNEACQISDVHANADGTVLIKLFKAFTTPLSGATLKLMPNYALSEINAIGAGTLTVRQIDATSGATYAANSPYNPDSNDYGMQAVLLTPSTTAIVTWN